MEIQYPDHLEQLTVRLDPRAEKILAGLQPDSHLPGKSQLLAAVCGGMILGVALVLVYQEFKREVPPMYAENDITPAEIAPEPVAVVNNAPAIGADTRRIQFLQIATFRQEQRALDLKQRLEKFGLPDVLVFTNRERKPLYRVRVGPLQGPDHRDEIRAQLRDAGFADTLLVQSNQPAAATVVAAAKPVIDAGTAGMEIKKRWGTRSAATQLVLQAGISAMRAGDVATAESKFRQVLVVEPDATQASTYLFTLLMDQDRVDAADAVAMAGLAEGSDVTVLAKRYAQSLLNRGKAADALRVLEYHRPAASGDAEYAALLAGSQKRQNKLGIGGP